MAVKSFLPYALEVPDQSVGQRYYQDFGLVDATGRNEAVHLRPARQARETVLLYAGSRKRLHHLCFGATGEDWAQVRPSLDAAGAREVDPPRHAPEVGGWVRDPDGNLVNVREESPPTRPADPPPLLNGPGYTLRQAMRGAPERGSRAAPRRLGHVLLFTPDVD